MSRDDCSDKDDTFFDGALRLRNQFAADEITGAQLVAELEKLHLACIPSSTAFVPEGERKSLAGQAIEMAISALRDIQRRAPGTRTFFDYETFIERELVPAMAMADKDRQGCIGLMGLLAKEKLKVEELSKPVSAIERTPTYDPMAAFDQCDGGLPCIATTTGCAKGQCSRRKHAAAMSGVSVSVSYGAGEWFAAKVTGLDALGLGFVEATGRQFAFTFDRIDGYRGERPKEIGLKIGAIVHVLVNDGKVDRLSLKGRPASNDISNGGQKP